MNTGTLAQCLPEIILMVGACVVLLLGVTRVARSDSGVSLATVIVIALAFLVAWLQGAPDEPGVFAGLAITPLTFYARLTSLGVGFLLALLNWRQAQPEERGEYLALVLCSLLGLLLTASASNLVLLFLALELVSVPTYVLVALSRVDSRASEGAVKYFFLGALSAALMAYGFVLLYGAFGTADLIAVARIMKESDLVSHPAALIGLLLAFGGLSFKIAAVPFHAYVADVYEGAASPMTALLGFVPKMAGFLALIHLFSAIEWRLPLTLSWVIWIVAALTMTVGNLLALMQKNLKRLLAYSSVAHSGYMLIGLLVGPTAGSGPMSDGVVALLFYMVVYGLMNLGAFAVLCGFQVNRDQPIEWLEDLSGLSRKAPLAAFALAACAFSLMGFPPTAGFLGKVYIFSGAFSWSADRAFHTPLVVLAVIGVINSAIGAAYYLRIVSTCYMNPPRPTLEPTAGRTERFSLVVAGLAMLVWFVWPGMLIDGARRASGSGESIGTLQADADRSNASADLASLDRE